MASDDDMSSDDEEMFMQAQRRKFKATAHAAADKGCLPADAVCQRPSNPMAAMMVLQEAMQVLEDILSPPTKDVTEVRAPSEEPPRQEDVETLNANSQEADPLKVVSDVVQTPVPTRPTSPKTATSRPTSRATAKASGQIAPHTCAQFCSVMVAPELAPIQLRMPFSSRPSSDSETKPSNESDDRPTSLAVLPPVTPPRRNMTPTCAPTASAMEMDLGSRRSPHSVIHTGATNLSPVQKRQSRSQGSLRLGTRSSQHSPDSVLPALLGNKASKAMVLPYARTDQERMLWDVPKISPDMAWGGRNRIF